MDLYSEIILDHYKNPHNKGHIDSPTCKADEENPQCGDTLSIELKIENSVVTEVAFNGAGCAISQAATSMLTDYLKGKSIEEINKLKPDDIYKMLGIDISPGRIKCALLGLSTTQQAIKNHNNASKKD
ncbi:SUF system NifU family Fe-S cluster assembly protein [Candidatus Peregrinibacteria bacterium]|jgi:nitrogen fixation protein NifU and related proteins|nr:SUF system NifU family Fe-S cluster assembly protein [Candidatus Peregrinibacteria bacterium]MBT7736929.1 SUF system NifU family Fe-S cluster assembly protein [Candidatus Peregrinibacteria bacterium]